MTDTGNFNIHEYLVPGKQAHLVGIGGVSMRPLGLVLQMNGLTITGSDMNSSVSTQELEGKGIRVCIGHSAENIRGADCIIRTAAVHNDNPEIAAARALGIPVFERAEAWGVIMQRYKNAICISGTHGKTTTSSMITHIFLQAEKDPTVMIGGNLPILGTSYRVGQGDYVIMESCEYCNSFLNFFPTTALVLNIEEDHLDFFKDLADIQNSFRRFAELVPPGGTVIINGEDENTVAAMQGLDTVTFGMQPGSTVFGTNFSDDYRSFDLYAGETFFCHLDLKVYGRHNAQNAIAAAAVAWCYGIRPEDIAAGLAAFGGAGRRMEYKGSFNGADIYDDYAHHPGELHALFTAARLMKYKRIIAAFQPHTYTRTKALFDDFVRELQLPDVTILAEIYAARERNTIGISSRDLCAQIPGSQFCSTLPQVTEQLRAIAQPGDLILTVGAGDIYRVGDSLCRK